MNGLQLISSILGLSPTADLSPYSTAIVHLAAYAPNGSHIVKPLTIINRSRYTKNAFSVSKLIAFPIHQKQDLRMAIVVEYGGKVRGWAKLCTCLMGNAWLITWRSFANRALSLPIHFSL